MILDLLKLSYKEKFNSNIRFDIFILIKIFFNIKKCLKFY